MSASERFEWVEPHVGASLARAKHVRQAVRKPVYSGSVKPAAYPPHLPTLACVRTHTPSMAYEAWPPVSRPSLHEVFLGGWGLPIGETFDLRNLAAECDRLQRWTFLFTSVALYVPGGIASPANAQAVL